MERGEFLNTINMIGIEITIKLKILLNIKVTKYIHFNNGRVRGWMRLHVAT